MPSPPDDQAPAAKDSAGGTIRFLLLLALGAWILRSLIVAPFSIPSGSMLPTMAIGDYLFVAKWPYGYSRYSFPFQFPPVPGRIAGGLPQRGDIVIFKRPGDVPVDWVKRVIGLPGDRIALSGGIVTLNGEDLPRTSEGMLGVPITPNSPCKVASGATPSIVVDAGDQLCRYPVFREILPGGRSYRVLDQVDDLAGDDFGPITVPDGHLFMMGDNRDDSLDSRYTLEQGGIGMVPVDHLVGKATFAFWSTDGSASYWLPWTWFSALRSHRIGKDYRP